MLLRSFFLNLVYLNLFYWIGVFDFADYKTIPKTVCCKSGICTYKFKTSNEFSREASKTFSQTFSCLLNQVAMLLQSKIDFANS